jgi:hypothetical protein
MPGLGNPMRVTSQFFQLPERFQNTVNAGVPLFEARRTQPFNNTQKTFGLWDARATFYVREGTFDSGYRVSWYTNDNCYVEFRPGKLGICTGFIPDDRFWHNRIVMIDLLESNQINIERLHTPDGTIPSRLIVQELSALRDYINEWRILVGEKIVFRGSKDDASSYVAEKLPETDNYQLLTGRTAEIEKLIKKYGGGWMECQEFEQEHRPRIAELITKRQPANNPVPVSNFADLLKGMTQGELKQVAEMFRPFLGNQEGAPEVAAKSNGEVPIENRDINELRQIAKTYSINTKGLTKESIIDQIKDAVTKRTASQAIEAIADVGGKAPEYDQFREDEDQEEMAS